MDSTPEKTSWRLVLETRADRTSVAREAMNEFARRYWPPVYGHVRRKTGNPDKALDLTQEFFAAWIEKGWMGSADPERGRFRTYLFVVLDRFLMGAHDREKARKRGGEMTRLPIDPAGAERIYASGPRTDDPGKGFTQEWALTVVRETLEELRKELGGDSARIPFDLFARYYGFGANGEVDTHATLGKAFDLSESDVNNYLQKARALFRRSLEARVLQSLEDPADLKAEIGELFRSLSP